MTNLATLVGADFTLSSMSDNFVEVILGALNQTNTSTVHMETDDVSTVVRGRLIHVFDVTKSICVHAAKTGKHISFHAQFSTGCPGNEETDQYLAVEEEFLNEHLAADEEIYAAAKFSLYPIGAENFMETILSQIEEMKAYVKVTTVPYATKLEGKLVDIFKGLEKVFQQTINSGAHHPVMIISISMNSPSHL